MALGLSLKAQTVVLCKPATIALAKADGKSEGVLSVEAALKGASLNVADRKKVS